jgi:mono/diheme cytochrome c family protein
MVTAAFFISCPAELNYRMFRHLILPILFMPLAVAAEETVPHAEMDARHKVLLQDHCVRCHGPEKQKGRVRLDDLPFELSTVETAEKWQKVLDAMNSGEMPPEDEKQPSSEGKTDFLDDLSNVMVAARRSLSDQQGMITMRRLNRREYKNTLRELLGVNINVSELPSDTGTGGFDTAGQNLFLSANQLEQYHSLGREALEEAFAWQAAANEMANTKPAVAEESKFDIGKNRQLTSISVGSGINKIRYECETANDKVSTYVAYTIDARERANKWKAAVEAAAAEPKNAEIVANLRKESKNDAIFRRSWEKIPGAPNPRTFGFDKGGENDADKANDSLGENWQKYHEYYLSRPALDRGAYLGSPTMHPQEIGLGFLQFPVPRSWASGDYILRVCVAAAPDARPEQRFLEAGMHPRNGMVRATFEITGTLEQPQIVEMPFTLTRSQTDAGDRTLFIREKGSWDNNDEGLRKRAEAVRRNGIGPEAVLWVDYMEIERVNIAAMPQPPALAALGLVPDDKAPPPPANEAHAAIARFAKVAFRGTEPPESFQQQLAGLYDTLIKSGTKPGAALKDTLSIVLAAPMFLYLAEPAADGKRRVLTTAELATRLSYFLWSAPPDKELLHADLMKPDVLAAQTTRLLNDTRSRELIDGFVFQWLGMERLDFFEVNRPKFPRFDDSTRLAAKHEVYETFAHILKHNAPIIDLLKADYIVANRLLADFYGIPDVKGDTFQKVPLPKDSPRGGLLGMAAINVMGGNGDHTSPVERGAWVLRKLLNDPPPPAPANIPQITRLAGQVLTTRERLAAHQEDAQCASCHRKIDPIGFGLENFDAVGQWRTEDTYQVMDETGKPVKGASKTWQIEASSALHNGPAFLDYFQLRDIIAAKSDAFAKGFSSALIEYALGRPVGFRDESLIGEIFTAAQREKLGMRAFIHALVASKEFHTK